MIMIKNKIIYEDFVLGSLTFQDLIYYIDDLIKSYKEQENNIINVLKTNGFNNKNISCLLKNDFAYDLNFIKEILENL